MTSAPEPPGAQSDNPVEPIVDWARAIAFGIRDTAKDMLEAGREGAGDAYVEYWRKFDRQTRSRRKHVDDKGNVTR